MQPIETFHDVTAEDFSARIRPRGLPALLKGLVQQWPAVRAGRAGQAATTAYLAALATEEPLAAVIGDSHLEGRLHHGEDLREANFERRRATVRELLHWLTNEAGVAAPRTIAGQGLVVSQYLPGFNDENPLLLLPGITARAWIGNSAKVATHNDPSENIACCVAGRRRFTVFPPEQIGNLYLGPFHYTPAGTQVSMVHLTKPDLERYPRFAQALQSAKFADLEPGDALYLPYQWFHHVEAFDTLNVLVNYWWNPARGDLGSPWDAMLHGIMSLRGLPPEQRRAWRAAFDHYVFLQDGDPGAHLPEYARGILGANTPQDIAQMRRLLLQNLGGQNRGG